MEQEISGLNVIVTGASRGIGRAVAVELARRGARLSLVARSPEGLEEVGKAAAEAGADAIAIPVDLTHPEAPAAVVAQTVEHLGAIDVLINNAGAALGKPFRDTTIEEWQLLMDLNARVPFFLTQQCLPYLLESQVRTVVNISSVVGRKGYPQQSAYGASKHALIGLTKSLARELQSEGVRFHVVAPGSVATDMIQAVRPDIESSELMAPEEIADVVVFLLSHRGNAVIDEVNIRRASGTPW